jgi:phosphoglucomutase
VLAGNGVEVMLDSDLGYTPTPALSHAVLAYNQGRSTGLADGVVISPSHNPPADGGFKYNPPNGGPADTSATKVIEARANELLKEGLTKVSRLSYAAALRAGTTHAYDFVSTYVDDLPNVIDIDSIRGSGLRLAVDPLGGAGVAYWAAINQRFNLDIESPESIR